MFSSVAFGIAFGHRDPVGAAVVGHRLLVLFERVSFVDGADEGRLGMADADALEGPQPFQISGWFGERCGSTNRKHPIDVTTDDTGLRVATDKPTQAGVLGD